MRAALGVALCILTAGCISTSVRHLDPTPRPARAADAVAALDARPDRPYTVVAVVRARSSTVFDSFGDLRRKLMDRAAQLGGEAVILGPRSTKATPIFNTVGFVMSEQKSLMGEVIVFRSPS
jgi:hypothetical protein